MTDFSLGFLSLAIKSIFMSLNTEFYNWLFSLWCIAVIKHYLLLSWPLSTKHLLTVSVLFSPFVLTATVRWSANTQWRNESDSEWKAEKLPKVVVLDSAKAVLIVWTDIWLLLSDGAEPGPGQSQDSAGMRPGDVPYCLEGSEQMAVWWWAAVRLNHSSGRYRCQKEKEKYTAIHLVCLFVTRGEGAISYLCFPYSTGKKDLHHFKSSILKHIVLKENSL